MGVVNLPSTGDYWLSHPCMPHHSVMTEHGMSRDHFYFMWWHFHIYDNKEIDVEEEEGDDEESISKEEYTADEWYLEHVVHDEEYEYENDEEEDEDCNAGESDEGSPGQTKQQLGTFLSLDEMMMRFGGRSLETRHMKNKPIGESYKFFCLATKERYIINSTPNGRTAAESQTQE
eukprot:14972069-Ditylum_brightwellii.AAC.1